jgi:hypothetical protein
MTRGKSSYFMRCSIRAAIRRGMNGGFSVRSIPRN